ncbi:HEPN domain-containing protein [Candidatus Bathyarchaeota archaeon]|nr:HEPN domain-containing protein [Candidatus Bathyarchaeota archaeon]MBS7628080.1 HEPN domain-containing protein [Candidatus Bathyarchaeota archaeon]
MLDETEYERWIKSSKRTLDSAKGDCERGEYNWTCFKSHQSAKLAVKALLHGLGLHAYGHRVSGLLARVELGAPGEIFQGAKTLDKYYVPTRYPNAWAEGSPEDYYTCQDAKEAIEYAEAIIKWVEEIWKSLKEERGFGKRS